MPLLKLTAVVTLFIAVGAIAAGCSWIDQISKYPLFDVTRVGTQKEAGSAHIAVLSVARWEAYQDAVQPSFSLTADQALSASIPDTAAILNSSASSVAGSLSVSTGTASAAPVTPPSVDVTKLGNSTILDPTKLSTDPMLRYWAATALFQEVQLLNRYISDAAISDRYYPYIVRMQITLMPNRRNLPYDAYTSVAFFNDDFSDYPPIRRLIAKPRLSDLLEQAKAKVLNRVARSAAPRADGSNPLDILWNAPPPRTQPAPSTQATDVVAATQPTTKPSFPAEEVRTEFLRLLGNQLSDVEEALPADAIRDGMIAASAHKCSRPGDAVEYALAYARDRSPRFAGFRGFDPSQYVVPADIISNAATAPGAERVRSELESYRKHRTGASDPKTAYTPGEEFAETIDKYRLGDTSPLVSIEDFELSLNDAAPIMRQAATESAWDDVFWQLAEEQLERGNNFRPLIPNVRPKSPIVIPLLVTDDLQAAIESRNAEQIRQLALSIAAAAGKANIQGGLASLDEQLRSALGRSLDSTFTIARKSDNSIMTRFGASYQAGSQYAMVPDAHNVTLLVLVPKAYVDSVAQPMVHLEAKSKFVDSQTGKELDHTTDLTKAAFVQKVLDDNGIRLVSGGPLDLIQFVSDNDFDDFQAQLGGPEQQCEKVWTELLEWYLGGEGGFSTIRLDKPAIPRLAPIGATQALVAVDDTKKSTTVSVRAIGDIYQQNVSAELWISPSASISTSVELSIPKDGKLAIDTSGKARLQVTTTQPIEIGVSGAGDGGVEVLGGRVGTVELAATQPAALRISTTEPAEIALSGDSTQPLSIDSPAASKLVASAANAGKTGRTTVILSTSTAVLSGKIVQFTFPSLSSLNLASKEKPPKIQLKVRFFHSDKEEWAAQEEANTVDLAYVTGKPQSLDVSLAAGAKVINADPAGEGDALLIVSGYDPAATTGKLFLSAEGADVTSATAVSGAVETPLIASADKVAAGKIPISSNGIVRVHLANLSMASNVTFGLVNDAGIKSDSTVVLTVGHGARETRIISGGPATRP